MAKGIFITATSTGVGKTVVSSIVTKKLIDSSLKCCYYKPVQTGGIDTGTKELMAGDCMFVAKIVDKAESFESFASYVFEMPASPHLAAGIENKVIDPAKFKSDYEKLSLTYDYIIVEGAGGLYVPLTEEGDLVSDIPGMLGINSILVADAGLGTINHVSLSYSYAQSRGIHTSAIFLLYHQDEPTRIETDNKRILEKLLGCQHVYLLPAISGVDTENLIVGDFYEKIDLYPGSSEILEMIDA